MPLLGKKTACNTKTDLLTLNGASCKSEFRLCIQGNDYDAAFDGSQGFFGLWHSACDGNLTYSPTTSSLSPLATTFGGPDCLTAESDCNVLSAATSTCSGEHEDAGDVRSCMCEASVLEIASLCDFGAGRCLGDPPNSTNLFSYQFCRQGQSPVTSTNKGSGTLSSTRIVLTQSPGITNTPTASPGSTPSAVSTGTSGGATHGVPCIGIWPVLSLTVWFLV